MRRANLSVTVVPVILLATVALVACGRAVPSPQATARHTAATPPQQSDHVLILAGYDGTVSVRANTGAVAFRAPFGMAAPDSSTVVQAQPLTAGTRVVASDPLTGVPRWSHDVAGSQRVRVVSPGGRFVALVDGNLNIASDPRTATTITVATAAGARTLHLAGNLDPEAFSVDGRYLYTLDFLPAMNPTHYSVRRIDLHTNRIEVVPDRNGAIRKPMPGYSSTQLMSPDGRQLYTFYVSAEPVREGDESYHAWVHVLNLEHGWAHCVELDDIGASGGANGGLAVSPDGSRLFVTDGTTGTVVTIDTATLKILRSRVIPDLMNPNDSSLDATDGHTLFVRDNDGGLSAINAQTLSTAPVSISANPDITALRLDRSEQALYLLSSEGLVVVDSRGRVVHRWPSPGDATSIDPAVTVPGRGAYRCAC